MSAHTPGPWRAAGHHVRAPETEDRLELDVLVRGGNRDDIKANVRLIAAAPDLLDALRELADCGAEAWGEGRPCVAEARAAIAKATGRAK